MTATITRLSDGATTTPDMFALPYEIVDESRNVETDLIGGGMAITLVPPRPAAGELTLIYATETDARAARQLHRARSAFTLDDTENPAAGMTYAIGRGGVRLALDEATQDAWVLTVSFREVEL
ncbi:hypothetical protein [Microbacterium kyungheense]|uniref:Uncharacterized protein n=1 Tax=Microbacterium kyungheense TaxID=1263636 RepID=A0A543EU62_9MICO|nr:hypothetical protein [Microbacterium kyungheense]TQM25117.1 hypothetical protein FB391_2576 [Microbacterium kyungheense]